MTGATERVAAFVQATALDDLPDGVIPKAKKAIAPPGSPSRELTWDDLQRKFADCARQTNRVGADKAQQAFEAIQKLDEVEDIASIVELLR